MSMSSPAEEKRHYVSVMQHTLHVVRTANQTVEFSGECALMEKDRVQKLLQAWSENRAVSGIVAIAPEPVWWHLGDSAEARTLHTDADVRRFAERLPHHLRGPLEMMACNAADGKGLSPDGDENWLLGVTQGGALAAAADQAIERGITTAALGSATLDSVAAAVTAVQLDGAGVMKLWAIGRKRSFVFTVGVRGIEAVDPCEAGFETVFAAFQQVVEAGTATEASARFFAQPPDPAAAERLASMIAPQQQSELGTRIAADAPVSFACAGLTGREAWFERAIAQAASLPHWQPNLQRYLEDLRLNLAVEPRETPSLSMLGTFHRAAIHMRRGVAWHPSWGLISRTAVARGNRRPISVAVATGPSPTPAPIAIAATAPRPTVPPNPVPVLLQETPAKPAVPPRDSTPVNVPIARQEVNGEAPTESPPEGPPAPSAAVLPLTSPQPTSAPPSAVPAVSATNAEATNTSESRPPVQGPTKPAAPPNPPAPSPPRAPRDPVKVPAVPPVPLHGEPSRASRPTSDGTGDRKPPLRPWSAAEQWSPPSEPTVTVRSRSGYWPLVGIFLALCGAGIGWKFHLDAEAVKAAAEKEKRAAEHAQGIAEREVAAAVEQVRRASEQAAQADQRARQLVAANARETERDRNDTDVTRQEAIEQARLEAIEQGRREAMEQARREAMELARREAEEQAVRIVARELAAARAAAAPGNLTISSVPAGADVQVDGRPVQRAPASIEGLPPGRHAVTLTLAGYVPLELTAEIVASKTTDLGPIKLERALGALAVTSSPAELEFSIRPSSTPADAAPLQRGRTPAQLNDLPTGEYVVQFSRAGWPDRAERVTVERGATARVTTAFEGGTVVINSSPTGATVLQGGLLLGKTPLTLGGLPPHDVTYELRADGFEPLKVSGTIGEGRQLELNGTLLDLNRVVNADEVRTPPRPYETTPVLRGRIPRSVPPFITVSLVVLPNGSPAEVRVLGKVDPKLARKSVEAIEKWKFFPGVSHAGYPVRVRMSMPVRLAGG
jgi:hypothetical protein